MNLLGLVTACSVCLVHGQNMPSMLIKQAADTILHAPFKQQLKQYEVNQGLSRIEIPSAEDLIIRRLQGELALRVDDNWQSLNDPQRWAIMQTKDPAKQILKSFEKIKIKTEELEKTIDVEAVDATLNNISFPTEDMVTWMRMWDNLRKKVGLIAQMYNYHFKGYIEKPDATNKNQLLEFATSATLSASKDRTLQNMLDLFHDIVIPTETTERALFPYLQSLTTKAGQHLCSMTESPHQLVYNLYNIIALTEIKGYAMLQFSYMMLKIYGKGNFSVESDAAKEKFELQATEKMNSIKMVLPTMSKEFMKCDPKEHKDGETYIEITKLLQGYIENEVDMNERQTCKSSCSAYTFADSKSCYKDLFCAKQPKCNGRIFDCQFFNADAWVCMAADENKRRYDWVEYEDGTLLGDKGTCVNKIKVDSWWRYLFWHCSYCFCKCDEITEDSDRYWSLEPALADTMQNKIVTGVRFVKRGKIVYPQIEQATALSEGGIDESSRSWIEPQQIAYNDTRNLIKNTKSVFTMSYEQRALDMDMLEAPEGHVLTGVKLRNIGGHLNLEIQVTPMEFTTGNVVSDRSTWIANDNTPATDNPRTLVPIIMPDVPTKFSGPNTVDTTNDQFIQFDATSAHKDVSQTTVPFIDAQPVAPKPATWLAGAGLYHKGRIGYGGFVGFKVITYDFSRHLIPDGNERPVLRYEFVKAEDV